jgi:hypothetical protein
MDVSEQVARQGLFFLIKVVVDVLGTHRLSCMRTLFSVHNGDSFHQALMLICPATGTRGADNENSQAALGRTSRKPGTNHSVRRAAHAGIPEA